MLSLAELQDLLDKVTYLPGWEITLYQGRHEGQHLVIKARLVDAYDQSKTVDLDIHSALPRMRDADQFYDWLLWRLERIASHETREFFHVGGAVYDDPHGPDADQDR